jgi:hypothetical protein
MSTISNITEATINGLKTEDELRTFLKVFLNMFETQAQQNADLLVVNQELRDEIARLNGGNPKPKIRPQSKPKSDEEKQAIAKGKDKPEKPDKLILKPDAIETIPLDKTNLPLDLIFKGYEDFTQQEVVIKRNVILYRRERYYSPSTGKYYTAVWPNGKPPKYGSEVRTLINVLHHFGDMTQGRLESFLKNIGLGVSGGEISNIIHEQADWVIKEQTAILQSALKADPVAQMDTTGCREMGKNKVTHLIVGLYFSIFYTLPSKSRLDCLLALQGNPSEGLRYLWDETVKEVLIKAKVGVKTIALFEEALATKTSYTFDSLNKLLEEKCPDELKKKTAIKKLLEALAYAYYVEQTDFPALMILLSDNAPEYEAFAKRHGLCWIHDGRYYKKLKPKLPIHVEAVDAFEKKYWIYYKQLLEFKEEAAKNQSQNRTEEQKEEDQKKENAAKATLSSAFDALFQANTGFDLLDKEINRTKANKAELLLVLDYPMLPLHNNAAELAARKEVRKRDISLHTCSKIGTQVKNAMMSIVATATKLRVSVSDYIRDRITNEMKMESLADMVANKMRGSPIF